MAPSEPSGSHRRLDQSRGEDLNSSDKVDSHRMRVCYVDVAFSFVPKQRPFSQSRPCVIKRPLASGAPFRTTQSEWRRPATVAHSATVDIGVA